ncbi:uncharacterized protein LOC108488003 [Gossypium arboreum]|uniref:uncharacterized protein LOC108488003 n=1 Tax=Gossypium arboreum TaxID=29729 RepID=UPI0008197687|nr:uncharacterized protein LOC108488003 [Gossypium arboreum]
MDPELVSETEDKVILIWDRVKTASDRQKSYVLPWKKVLMFGRKGKLIPRFIRAYQILRQVGPVAYQLDLPPELDRIQYVFYVSMLRCYHSDLTNIVPVKEIEVRPDLMFEEEPFQILDHDVKVL